jgi:hypothetical protein
MYFRTLVSLVALLASASVVTAAMAAATFPAPSGWRHVEQPNSSSDGTHKFDQWKLAGDPPQTITVIEDSTMSYSDALAAVKKNFTDNHIKPAIDKDETCLGRASHNVEFSVGTDGQIIINNLLVPDGNGVIKVTYARGKGFDYDPDAKKAVTDFCAQPG